MVGHRPPLWAAFGHLYGDPKVRWVATELVREVNGLHACDKRRAVSEAKFDFPHIDFSLIPHDVCRCACFAVEGRGEDEAPCDSSAVRTPTESLSNPGILEPPPH